MKFTNEQKQQMFKDAKKYWGEMAQYDQTIEEMAELMLAINKFKRQKFYNEYENDSSIEDNLIEEICDVELCLQQLISMHDMKKIEETETKKYSKFLSQIEKQKQRAKK